MIKAWINDLKLAVQSKSGISAALFVWLAILAVAALMAFIFLCVTGYAWLSNHLGNTLGALIMTGLFVVIAVVGAIGCRVARRRTIERAILARAARAHAPSWLLDPRLLSVGMQAGRALGWQRLVPIALLGFMAAQWAREHRGHAHDAQHDAA
jgi:hypothetical protein